MIDGANIRLSFEKNKKKRKILRGIFLILCFPC